MKYIPIFSENDQKIRKQWRLSLLGFTIFNAVNFAVSAHHYPIPFFTSTMIILLYSGVSWLLCFFINDYFVYKTHGIRWLTFSMICTFPYALYMSYFLFSKTPHPSQNNPMAFQIGEVVLPMAFMIPSYRIWKLNWRIQKEKKEVLRKEQAQ